MENILLINILRVFLVIWFFGCFMETTKAVSTTIYIKDKKYSKTDWTILILFWLILYIVFSYYKGKI